MFDLIASNLSTIVVGAAVAVLLLIVAVKMYHDKKRGKSSCGCNCANCPSAGMCHTNSLEKN